MTYEIFRYIFIIALILCGLLFVTSVILFILLNIPKVIQDLSGITAKKAIKEIREQNEKTGDKSYKVSQVNRERGKLTDKISESGRIIKQSTTMKIRYGVETEKIGTSKLSVSSESNETSVLDSEQNTTCLYEASNETSVLDTPVSAVDVSVPVIGETAVLSDISIQDNNTTVLENTAVNSDFSIEFEITFIHTNEMIETEVVV